MHAGDVFPDKMIPVVTSRGDPRAYLHTIQSAHAEIHGVDRVISGHGPFFSFDGPILPWADFANFVDFYAEVLDAVQSSSGPGNPLQERISHLKRMDRFQGFDFRMANSLADSLRERIN